MQRAAALFLSLTPVHFVTRSQHTMDTETTTAVVATAAGVLGLLLCSFACCCRGACCRSGRTPLSPFSAGMALGSSFPDESAMVPPTINAALYFDELPDIQVLRSQVCTALANCLLSPWKLLSAALSALQRSLCPRALSPCSALLCAALSACASALLSAALSGYHRCADPSFACNCAHSPTPYH